MSTVVFVHAHPDDEASQSRGLDGARRERGARVVLVVATNGDHGDAPDDLAEGETVVQRRRSRRLPPTPSSARTGSSSSATPTPA